MSITLGTTHTTIENGLLKLGKTENLDGGYPTVFISFDVQLRVGMSMQLLTLFGNFKRLNYIITLDKKRGIYTNHHRKAQCLDFVKQPVDVIKQEFHPKTEMNMAKLSTLHIDFISYTAILNGSGKASSNSGPSKFGPRQHSTPTDQFL
ncbi:unnamed protein product [Caenorhabditis nigoni]